MARASIMLLCAALLPLLGHAAGPFGARDTISHGRSLVQAASPSSSSTTYPATFGPPPPYDITLPPFPVNYTDDAMLAQRNAGTLLQANIDAAIQAGANSYTIPPGVYRLNTTELRIGGTTGFTLNAAGVELIVESNILHFAGTGNTNLTIAGPLLLDASYIGVTQAVIISSDGVQNITVQLMPNYPAINSGHRLMFFNTSGAMQPLYQITSDAVTANSTGPNYYDISMPGYFWSQYLTQLANALTPGNLIAFEQGGLCGGIFLGGNNGVSLTNLSVHSFGLVFIQEESGPIFIDSLYGTRRPGTNRLGGGGYVAASLLGGSLTLQNSELAYNFDDLTDLQSGFSYAQQNSTAAVKSVLIAFGTDTNIGQNITFWNVQTLQPDGWALITNITQVTDPNAISSFQNGLSNLGLVTYGRSPVNVTLSRAVKLTGAYDLIENQQTRAKSITVQNCYMHDSLASGINAKGANRITIVNNTVSRAGYRGAAVGFDPYWWEGPQPYNTLIQGNRIDSTPYNTPVYTGAINTYVDTTDALMDSATGSPTKNVTITGNIILNPPIMGIGLQASANNTVTNNTIVNPVATVGDTTFSPSNPYQQAAAIYVDFVGLPTTISNNNILQADTTIVPQLVKAGPQTATTGIQVCNNTFQAKGSSATAALPNAFWTFVNSTSSAILYDGRFNGMNTYSAFGGHFSGDYPLQYTNLASSAATFKFTGTRARFYSCLGPIYGTATLLVDGVAKAQFDASVLPLNLVAAGIVPQPAVGFCQVAVFDSGALPLGAHNLTVSGNGATGANSGSGNTFISVVGFDYLTNANTCPVAPRPPPPRASPPPPRSPPPPPRSPPPPPRG